LCKIGSMHGWEQAGVSRLLQSPAIHATSRKHQDG